MGRLQGESLDVQVHKDSSLASTAVAEEIIRLVKHTAATGSVYFLMQHFRGPCSIDETTQV